MDGVRAPTPLPLSAWPRRRLFPADPDLPAAGAADVGAEGLAYYLVEADSDGRGGDSGDGAGDGGRSAGGGDGDGDAAVWRVWLRLPPMEAGERTVRVRIRRHSSLCMLGCFRHGYGKSRMGPCLSDCFS